MFSVLNRSSNSDSPKPVANRGVVSRRSSILEVETLERRDVLATSLTASLGADGLLSIEGTNGPDRIHVRQDLGQIRIDGIQIKTPQGLRSQVPAPQVQSIEVRGLDGDDVIRLDAGAQDINKNAIINGGRGDDYLMGSMGSDTISGGTGNDRLYGGKGEDLLHGDAGNDAMAGGPGNDTLYGDDGNDTLNGEAGDDKLLGSAGDDNLNGQDGNDSLYGGAGADRLFGGAGFDGLFGGFAADKDYLQGDAGADRFLILGDRAAMADLVAEDARLMFKSSNADWSLDEIMQVDMALQKLHLRTGNTRLLKLSDGSVQTFLRSDGYWGANVLAANNSQGTIWVNTLAFTTNQSVIPVWSSVIHEIGHNWDTPQENTSIGSFQSLSDWRFSSTTGWTHASNASFVSWYAAYSPLEDFSETLASTFLSTSRYQPALAPAKVNFINAWLNSMR